MVDFHQISIVEKTIRRWCGALRKCRLCQTRIRTRAIYVSFLDKVYETMSLYTNSQLTHLEQFQRVS